MPSPVTSVQPAADAAQPALVESAAPVHGISIEHTFETAHRLPQLPGKCTSLHGHSWRVTIAVTAPGLTEDGTVVEYGALKAGVRAWIDTHLDHATMLGTGDPLVQPLIAAGCKVFRFGLVPTLGAGPQDLAADLAWPTVEAVAVLLGRMSAQILAGLPCAAGARVSRVVVRETHRNTASYAPVSPR
jgi:6-pyruvoyltetrahydropterin/6-carboxytetrahydropterin synthase